YFNGAGSLGQYSAYLPSQLYITTLNVDAVDFALYPLTVAEFAQLTGPDQYQYSDNFQPSLPPVPEGPGAVTIQSQLNERILTPVPLAAGGSLAPGLYYLRMTPQSADLSPIYQLLVVSKNHLTLKTGLDEALVWATDLNSGQAVADLPVTLYNRYFEPLASGRTDADGVWRAALPASGKEIRDNVWDSIYALSPEGEPFAVTLSDWSDGLDPWEFNLSSQYYRQDWRAYLYTDRPMYRPGQVVFFKGVVRAEQDARYRLPDFDTTRVLITNDQGETVYDEQLPLTAYGTFAGQFQLAGEASLGFYTINADRQAADDSSFNLGSVSFSVAQYRKPEFQVSVETPASQVVQGAAIPVTVDAQFFFGGPVSDAAIRWTVLAADSYFQYNPQAGAPAGYFDFMDYDWTSGETGPLFGAYGRVILEKDGRTDSRGQATLSVPADLSDKGLSQVYTIEAALTDPAGGQQVAGRVQVIVHAGQFYVGARPEQYVGLAGQPLGAEIVTVDWDSRPVPNQRLTAAFYDHQWNCAMEKDPDTGVNTWTCNAADTLVATSEVTTDAQGQARASFTPPQGGTYKILVSGVDSGGRAVKTATYVWVTAAGGDYVTWRQRNDDRLNLVADRRSYRPGDTAEILIPSPFQGDSLALVTVERAGILQTDVIALTNNSTVYKLPITADFAPDVFVSVTLIKGVDANNPAPAFKFGLVKLTVSPEQQAITLTLTPDKTKVGPRDTVNYTLLAVDYAGQPVQAEFSLSLVDLAVLQLSAPNAGPILDAFYGERGLGVRTASSLTRSVDRLNVDAAAAKGGGGGAEAGFDEVRSNFLDTAYWQATITTDAAGQAAFKITLPDNLTTWRLDARGVTDQTLVGQGTVDIVATKD
ncbi:MAG: hypothetical protein KA764_22670, partial [Anaerolineales bacterium]|nr:hypothetical protein [Anaerolineales bacterium]